MEHASFEEERQSPVERPLWRNVPSRRWHAHLKGKLNGSREVVLVHLEEVRCQVGPARHRTPRLHSN
jgi:hypothetical protein